MMMKHRTGVTIAMVGWLVSFIALGLPMWKVTAFISSSVTAAQYFVEGLWMNCVYESTGQMQCRRYESLLEVSSDLQSGRVLMVASIFTSFFAFLASMAARECINGVEDGRDRSRFAVVGGVTFIVSSIMVLVPVSWCANSVINNFYNPMVPEVLRRELGSSLYIGWASSALQFLGGIILCFAGPRCLQDPYPKKGRAMKPCGPTGYPMKDYV